MEYTHNLLDIWVCIHRVGLQCSLGDFIVSMQESRLASCTACHMKALCYGMSGQNLFSETYANDTWSSITTYRLPVVHRNMHAPANVFTTTDIINVQIHKATCTKV